MGAMMIEKIYYVLLGFIIAFVLSVLFTMGIYGDV